MAAIALPAVCGTKWRVAADLVAVPALVALAASTDVVDHDAIADRQALRLGTERDHLAAWLAAGDDALVCLGSRPKMLAIDRANVAAADRRGAHPDEHLAPSRLGNSKLPQ